MMNRTKRQNLPALLTGSTESLMAADYARARQADAQAMKNGQALVAALAPKKPAGPISHFTDARLPVLRVSAKALAAMVWSIRKSPNEFSYWGVVEKMEGGFLMEEACLNKHSSSPCYSDPDMEWYADWLADKVADEGCQPWQLACWIHTHPEGVNTPSSVDEDTFKKNFGDQRLAFMVVMTKEMHFYARMSALVEPMDGIGVRTYTSSPMRVEFEEPTATPPDDMIAELDRLYPTLVEEYIPSALPAGTPSGYQTWAELADDTEDDYGYYGGYGQMEPGDAIRRPVTGGRRYQPKSVGRSLGVFALEHSELIDYMACYATWYEDKNLVIFELGDLLSLEQIACNCCEDGDEAPVWLASRVQRQLIAAMMDPKIKEEVANVIRFGDIAPF